MVFITTYPPSCPVINFVAFSIAFCMADLLRATSFSICSTLSFRVMPKLLFALPSSIFSYFSVKALYTVFMTLAFTDTPSFEYITVTVSHKPTRCKSAISLYSGVCHSCTKDISMFCLTSDMWLFVMYALARLRSLVSVISSSGKLNFSVKSSESTLGSPKFVFPVSITFSVSVYKPSLSVSIA